MENYSESLQWEMDDFSHYLQFSSLNWIVLANRNKRQLHLNFRSKNTFMGTTVTYLFITVPHYLGHTYTPQICCWSKTQMPLGILNFTWQYYSWVSFLHSVKSRHFYFYGGFHLYQKILRGSSTSHSVFYLVNSLIN